MTVPEERLKVLQMLEDGKISSEEAAGLLRALEGGRRTTSAASAADLEGRFMRIQVTDTVTGAARVNVSVPLKLVSVGLRIAERFVDDEDRAGFDRNALEGLLTSGALGKVIEVVDEEEHERVEIFVD
jgi:hypothetical protein